LALDISKTAAWNSSLLQAEMPVPQPWTTSLAVAVVGVQAEGGRMGMAKFGVRLIHSPATEVAVVRCFFFPFCLRGWSGSVPAFYPRNGKMWCCLCR